MLKFVWKQRISPYDVCRVCGERFMKNIIKEYLEERIDEEYERDIVGAYTYQIFMREGTQEMALLINFDSMLQTFLPLGVPEKLANPDFPIPISVILGDQDWVMQCDDGASEYIVANNKKRHGAEANYYI